MNQKLRILVTASFLMIFSSFSVQADGWYLGGGTVSANLEDDDVDEINRGYGAAFNAGYRASDLFGIEILLSSTIHDEDITDGDVFSDTLMVGGKFSFGGDDFRPYVVAGISQNTIEFDNFDDIDGDGTYWGIGADVSISQKHVINISYRLNDWEGDDSSFDYDFSNKMFTIAYNFYFPQ